VTEVIKKKKEKEENRIRSFGVWWCGVCCEDGGGTFLQNVDTTDVVTLKTTVYICMP
jgi:hypothetical protein